ncbi:hypothetical protein [Metaclostridioides mangenotii]|uniref:hypothetical protein n=1 Tax=Metaclostridioides mangenotii TaxID=1540 RepID=UPI00046385D9|nr:hypothetical protein [Clostridioides mangenotii]
MELDSDRKLKSGRLPNPLVPFSYITANINYEDSIIAPIYIPSPTISDNNLDLYKNCFINDEDLNIIYGLITGNKEIYLLNSKYIRNKSLEITKLLIDNRRIKDTLTSEQLFMLLDLIMKSSSKLLFEKDIMKWSKSITINLTDSMENIFKYCKNYCYAMGSKTLPFCLIPEDKKNEFISLLDSIYKDKNIIDKIKNSKKPIALVWIAGFKPRGDDSRPDRGLLPLFKMLFGDEYTVLSLIFGPMKNTAINTLINNPHKLINSNGLWKSLYTQSDYIIVDNYISGTSDLGLCKIFGTNTYTIASNNIIYNPCSTIPKLGEDDIDTIIHSIFRTFFNNNFSSDTTFIYESLCNPPGGDWSGIEFLDITRNILFRWSSLPRVSGEDKRPDHIVQFKDKFLIVESKLYKRNLECNIGPRLKNYVRKLVNIPAIAYKNYPLGNWTLNNNTIANTYNYDYLSAIAFLKNNKTHDIYYSNTKENTFFDYNEEYYSELFNLTNTDIIFEITIYSNTVLIDISSRNEMVKNWVENMVKYNKNIVSLKNSKNIYINIF